MSAPLIVVLLLTGMAPAGGAADDEDGSAAWGSHLVTRFSISDANGHATAVFAAQDAGGDLVFLAYVSGNRLYVSDGEDNDIARPFKVFVTAVDTAWVRLDATLAGDHYTMTLDGLERVTARTSTAATLATPVADPRPLYSERYESVQWARTRADLSDGVTDTTFTTALDQTGWSRTVTAGELNVLPDSLGRQSRGMAEVVPSTTTGVAFFHAPLEDYAGAYAAEASVHLAGTLPPLGQAVLAGVDGPLTEPTTVWAVETDLRLDPPDRWGLFLVTPDGREPVGPSWRSAGWHDVRVRVDEVGDRIDVWVDGALAASKEGSGLGASAYLAGGDIEPDLVPTTTAYSFYDELALYKEVAP